MDENYLILDQSTSATKLLLVKNSKIIKRLDKKHEQYYPTEGWVEHDPLEIWRNIEYLFHKLLREEGLDTKEIQSISITNQRETIIAWDKVTGNPVCNALVWQDNRSTQICQTLVRVGLQPEIQEKTGLLLDPYFSGTKIKWLYENIPEIRQLSQNGNLAIGTMDSWLIWKMSQGEVFATEPSNACRTLLYNIHTNEWDSDLLKIFGASKEVLPQIYSSSDYFGTYKNIPIKGVMADSQAALVGENAVAEGDVKVTLGTGCSILMMLGNMHQFNNSEILMTIVNSEKGCTNYALEGIIRSCADSINWFNDSIAHFDDINEICNQIIEENHQEIIFIPALSGIATPFWNNAATGSFLNLRRNSRLEDLLFAILESIIFQIKMVLNKMEQVSGLDIRSICVDGGVTKNRALMQKLSNLTGRELYVSEVEELSALGTLTMIKGIPIQQKYDHIFPKYDQVEQKRYTAWENKMLEELK
ncbi:FGGY-family carbohydrate kinase [Lactococcus lactis]|uniref:FGGY-family carbohydrate kinase n=1 Tax=Lactococcus lactis TaxID=1358 RepID=UPI0028BD1A5E|nr:FGGY family carbohydrate kinase [Lactococcus lactis]WNN67625.1 FGGY family carbohydrate kinase [Lactococcus lactis]WPK09628.1 FGGY family carbohydrate kinase [Lactococcus lactis]